jgi:micrococcal nuclease
MMWPCLVFGLWCTVTGPAKVHDGDTMYVAGHAIRLAGIDAEELDEPHGLAARDALISLTRGRVVVCHVTGKSYHRFVAWCELPGAVELGQTLVATGTVLDCAHYSGGRYRKFEPPGARARLIQKPYC